MIDRDSELPISQQTKLLGIGPGQRVLPAPGRQRSRIGPDAPNGRTAPGRPVTKIRVKTGHFDQIL